MLTKRIISGAILLILAIGFIYMGGIPLWGACFVVGMTGIKEISDVMELKTWQRAAAYAGTAAYYALISPWGIPELLRPYIAAAMLVGLIVMSMHVFMYPRFEFNKTAFCVFMIIYPGIMSSAIYLIERMPYGRLWAYLVMAASWGSDTCAYVTGMTLGKHHPFPVLSPKKSVEGCIGGIVGAVIIGIVLTHYMGGSVGHTIGLAAAGAVAGELGDLAASSIKRRYGKKDYSDLIAGHGGVMDRFDSTLFSGALMFCLTALTLWVK